MYFWSGIFSRLEKEGNSIFCDNVDEAWGHFTDWKTNIIQSHLYVESKNKITQLIEAESRMVVTQTWEMGRKNWRGAGQRVQSYTYLGWMSRELVHGIMTILNIMFNEHWKYAKRVDFKCTCHI